MSHYLPPQIMAFFQPRPPMHHKDPMPKRTLPGYHGIAMFVPRLFLPVTSEPVKHETREEVKERRKRKRERMAAERLKRQLAKWDPKKEEGSTKTKDAYKTLFVARLSYDVNEDDLKKEFEFYGPVKLVRIMKSKKGKSRGYAFVEFESSKDLKEAYKDADGRKINGRRILVDVERGRTVKDWKPRRLGGGLGTTRAIGSTSKYSGREPPSSSSSSSSTRRRSRDRPEKDNRDRDRDRDRGGDRGGDRRDNRDKDRGDKDRDRDRDHKDRDREKDKDKDRKERRRSRSPRKDRDRSRERDYRR